MNRSNMSKALAKSLVCLSAIAWGAHLGAAEKEADGEPKFLRVQRNEAGRPVGMETAIARYRSADGVVVDLIGVVHIADKPYYEELNTIFKKYDSVLYELVAPEGKLPKPGKRKGALGGFQSGMSGMLELAFQLDHVDYTADNFVHADMSPEEFSKSMTDRGESVWQIVFRSIGYSAARQGNQGGTGELGLLAAMFSKNRANIMKRQIAQQFEDLEGNIAALEGPKGSTLIGQRNRKAFEVLADRIKAGDKTIAVFYGAGHLPDMDKRLLEDFQMQRQEFRWLRAWSMEE